MSTNLTRRLHFLVHIGQRTDGVKCFQRRAIQRISVIQETKGEKVLLDLQVTNVSIFTGDSALHAEECG